MCARRTGGRRERAAERRAGESLRRVCCPVSGKNEGKDGRRSRGTFCVWRFGRRRNQRRDHARRRRERESANCVRGGPLGKGQGEQETRLFFPAADMREARTGGGFEGVLPSSVGGDGATSGKEFAAGLLRGGRDGARRERTAGFAWETGEHRNSGMLERVRRAFLRGKG